MDSITEQQRQRDRILGILGGVVASILLARTWSSWWNYWTGPPTVPSAVWFVVATATCLALLVWSVGRLTGWYYAKKQLYRLTVGGLASIGVGAALVLAGYLVGQ